MLPPTFVRFGPSHCSVLLASALLVLALVLGMRRAAERTRAGLCALIALLLVAAHALEWLGAWWQQRLSLQHLPLQLCDVSAALAVWALLTRDVRVFEPLYFFALCGTLPALLTPELAADFPDPRFVDYFAPHALVVVATLVLALGLGMHPERGAWARAFGLLNGWAAVAGAVNVALGTNFMYLCQKPVDPTPLDSLGPWPTYLLQLEPIVLLLFFVVELPTRVRRARFDA